MSVTKKDLQELYGLSDNTVYKTLEACGLSTSRRSYQDDEIDTRFAAARKMLDAGKTYQEVKEYFCANAGDAAAHQEPEFSYTGHAGNQATDASGAIQQQAFEVVNAIASKTADNMLSVLPSLVMLHFANKAQQGVVNFKDAMLGFLVPDSSQQMLNQASDRGELPLLPESMSQSPHLG